jgi:putative FmdB family regulatory protein
MPIYEYECQKCGHALEALQKVSDAPLKKCPECGALRLKRLVSAPQFRLKGTGWYETDFKKDNKKRLVESGDGGKEGDSKPAAESAGKTDQTTKVTPDKAGKPEKKEQAAGKKPASGAPPTTSD